MTRHIIIRADLANEILRAELLDHGTLSRSTCFAGGPSLFELIRGRHTAPKTIAWGYYDASAPPVLRVQSGDTVEIQTVSGNPSRLESAGVPAAQVERELRAIL